MLSRPALRNSGTAGNTNRAATVEPLQSDWLIYGELAQVGPTAYAHQCTLVSPITVALFAGPLRLPLDALYEPRGGMSKVLNINEDSQALI